MIYLPPKWLMGKIKYLIMGKPATDQIYFHCIDFELNCKPGWHHNRVNGLCILLYDVIKIKQSSHLSQ
ncbi:MAG: hypothetical protein CVU46_10960 [Chloroflexi bacterium HGW-Chloroflexi-8]|nr:MAG: hypothetical protein CVU46_10960 [Chloroflexi bacterium HGW-Chloroflexi-8]